MRRTLALLVLALGGLFGAGCADQTLALPYHAPEARVDPTRPRVSIVPPPRVEGAELDGKGRPILGHIKNGFGGNAGATVPKSPVPPWAAEALASELAGRGYPAVVVPESPASGRVVRMAIPHMQIETDPQGWSFMAQSEITLELTVLRDGATVDTITVQGHAKEHAFNGRDRSFREQALRDGLKMTIEQAMPRLEAALR